MKKIAAAAVALALGCGIALLGAALPASATTVPPVPPGLNVLGSEASAAAVSGATTDQTMLSALLYKFAQTPTFWQAVAAQNAGTATAAQTSTVASATADFAVPATAEGVFTKTLGGAGVAVGGYQIGTMLGHAAVNLVGVDSAGNVCSQFSGIAQVAAGWLTGNDCGQWQISKLGAQVNADLAGIALPVSGVVPAGGGLYPPSVGSSIGGVSGGAVYSYGPSTDGTSGPNDLAVMTQSGYTFTFTNMQLRAWANGYGFAGDVQFGCSAGGVVTALPNSYSYGTISWPITRAVGAVYTTTYTVSPSACPSGSKLFGWLSGDTSAGQRAGGVFWTDGASIPKLGYGDPQRVLSCILAYTDGTSASANSAAFTEGSGVLPSTNCPAPTPGLTVGNVKVLEVGGGVSNTLYDKPTTAPYQTAPRECDSGTCLLDLKHNGVSCFQSPDSCTAWFTDPNKSSTYSCSYGTHAVDLSECTVYAPTFTAQARATGNYYGDPSSGDVLTNPGVVGGAATGTAASDPDPATCWGSVSWGDFNPLDWVLTPVKCALQWAFVPRESVLESSTAGVQDAWAGTSIAQAPGLVAGVLPTNVPSGCGGVPIDMDFTWPMVWGIHWTFGAACTPPLSTTAAVVSAITGFLVLGGTLYSSARYLASIIEFTGPAGGGS